MTAHVIDAVAMQTMCKPTSGYTTMSLQIEIKLRKAAITLGTPRKVGQG